MLNLLSPAGRRGRLMIFGYHRVLARHDNLLPEASTAEIFEKELQWIREFCTPLALSEAVARMARASLPARAAAVTFDDGYANNLGVAAPLLKKYGIPGIVFVAVDAVERGVMWNDVVIEAVRAAAHDIDADAIGLGRIQLSSANKLDAVNRLLDGLRYRPAKERFALAEALYYGVSDRPIDRQMLKPAQLNDLAEFGIEIGAHTVTHPILSMLSDSEGRAEIEDSASWIAEKTGTRPTLFAYPNGRRGSDYDERHVRIVQSLGFSAAVSTNWGCATTRSSLFELPRFKPWEVTEFGFYSRLCKVALQSYL